LTALRVFDDAESLGEALAAAILSCRGFAERELAGPLRLYAGAAARAGLVLHGGEKRFAAQRLLALDSFDPAWPASIVYDHDDAEIWLDRAAHP
jgi:hypothetical protein